MNRDNCVETHVLLCSATLLCKQACVFARIRHVTAPRCAQFGAQAGAASALLLQAVVRRELLTSTVFEPSRKPDNSQKTAVGPHNIGTVGLTVCHIAPWRYRADHARAELSNAVGR